MIVKVREVRVGDFIWVNDPFATGNPPPPSSVFRARVERVEVRPNGFIALWTDKLDPLVAHGPDNPIDIERVEP